MTVFNPDKWLTSAFNTLEETVKAAINNYIRDAANAAAGLQLYEISMDWFTPDQNSEFVPMNKTIIHFALDDVENAKVGFGQNMIQYTEVAPTIPAPGTITPHYARRHQMNFDVGIWASDRTGGSSARLEVYEMLDKIFNPVTAIRFADGVEIMSYNGGRFVTDTINDIRVYRTVGSELVTRVYSRDYGAPDNIVEGEPVQNPNLVIDSNVLLS